MTRSVPEWIGKSDESKIPQRVKDRIFLRQEGLCAICGCRIGIGGKKPEYDHKEPLIGDGQNRESNIQALCKNCHGTKTKADVAQKSKEARVRGKHLGIKKPKKKIPYRKFNGEIVWPD